MNRKNLGRTMLVVLPFLLALTVGLVLVAMFGDRLPARPAVHFAADGSANGHVGRTVFVVLGPLLPVLLAAIWACTALRGKLYGRTYDWFVAGGYATAAFFGHISAATLFANVDVADGGPGAVLPMWQLLSALGVAALAAGPGLLAARLIPAPHDPAASAKAPYGGRIALAEGEVAGWARSAGSWWLLLSALALPACAVVVLFTAGWPVAVPLLLLGLFLLTFARPNVTVDRRGITVSGLLARPRIHVPLDRIQGAASQDVRAMAEYGGWGYRVRPGRSGVITRSGEAIVARLTGGRDFAVTVDDSATGAALLNTLIDRHRAER